MAIELADVYINLVPSLRGAPQEIVRQLGGGTARRMGTQIGTTIVDGITAALRKTIQLPASLFGGINGGLNNIQAGIANVSRAADLMRRAFTQSFKYAQDGAKYIGKLFHGEIATIQKFGTSIQNTFQRALASMALAGGVYGPMLAKKLFGPLTTALAPISNTVLKALASIALAGGVYGPMLAKPFIAFRDNVAKALASVQGSVNKAFDPIRAKAASVFSSVRASIDDTIGRIGARLGPVGTVIGNTAQMIGATWSSTFAKLPDGLIAPFRALPGKIQGAVGNIGGLIARGVAGGINAVANASMRLGDAIKGGVQVGANAALAAVTVLTGAIASQLGGAVDRADQLFTFPKVMANIGYSAEEADQQIRRISASLDGLPTATQDVVKVAQGLAPMTGDLTKATDISLALNNALLSGGASTTLAANAMEQYRQQLAYGEPDLAAWKSMVNAMPGQMDMLAKSILGADANSMVLYSSMKDGETTFDQFNQALLDLNANGYNGFASFTEQAKVATGGIGTAVENAKNRTVKALAAIIEAIGVDVIADKINAITSNFVAFGDSVAAIINRTQEGGGFQPFTDSLGGILPVAGLVLGALGGMTQGIPILGSLFGSLTGPIGLVIGTFAAMWTQSETLRIAVESLGLGLMNTLGSPALVAAGQVLMTSISMLAETLGNALGNALNIVAPALNDLALNVGPALAVAFQDFALTTGPLVTTVFTTVANVISALMPYLSTLISAVLPILTALWGALVAAISPVVEIVGNALAGALRQLQPIFDQFIANVLPTIINGINQLTPLLSAIGTWIGNALAALLPPLVNIIGTLISVLGNIINAVLPPLINLFKSVFSTVLTVANAIGSVLSPAFTIAGNIISGAIRIIGDIFNWLWNTIINPVIGWITGKLDAFNSTAKRIADAVKSAFDTMGRGIKSVFDGVKSAVSVPIKFVIDTVYTGGIKKLADSIASALSLDFRLPAISAAFASGGVLPGYSPGRDIYHFTSHDGGGNLALSGGEAIMVPEWTRAVGGAPVVAAMNAAARAGRKFIPGGDLGGAARFADGGIWERLRDGFAGGVDTVVGWVGGAVDAARSIIQDPAGAVQNLLRAPVEAMLGSIPGAGFFKDVAMALPKKIIDGFGEWLSGKTTHMASSDIVNAARKAIGVPYIWGGSSIPPGLDCSGLVYWAANQMGVPLPRLTAEGYRQTAGGPANPNLAGNLLFWGLPAWHVAITSGNGMMVEAPRPGLTVREGPIWGDPYTLSYKFDNGGWLQPGHTSVVNHTGKPEAVFTAGQWDKLDELISTIRENQDGTTEVVIVDADGALIGRMKTEAIKVVAGARRR